MRELSATVAKMTKDMLGTGTPCPPQFVAVLKEQLSKLHCLMATLETIEETKMCLPDTLLAQLNSKYVNMLLFEELLFGVEFLTLGK